MSKNEVDRNKTANYVLWYALKFICDKMKKWYIKHDFLSKCHGQRYLDLINL